MKWTSLALIATGLVVGIATSQAQGEVIASGKTMIPFSMKGFNGQTYTNGSLRGKPFVIDMWATWCGPCKAASPTMQALHTKYKSKGLVVIGANVMERDQGVKARKYPLEHKYTYPFAFGDQLAKDLKVRGIPAFIFVGKDGKVKGSFTGFGPDSPARFEALVKTML